MSLVSLGLPSLRRRSAFRRGAFVLLATLALPACGVLEKLGDDDEEEDDDTRSDTSYTADGFASGFADSICAGVQECSSEREFEQRYGTLGECKSLARDMVDCFAECSIDTDAADACVESISDASCRDLSTALDRGDYGACDNVFECDNQRQAENCVERLLP